MMNSIVKILGYSLGFFFIIQACGGHIENVGFYLLGIILVGVTGGLPFNIKKNK